MMGEPTLAGFLTFLRNIANINTTVLPDTSPVITFAFNYAMNICSDLLPLLSLAPGNFLYITAVYNLGTDILYTYAQDQPGQVYFTQVQQKYQLHTFVSGVVTFAGDEGTQSSLTVPEAFKGLTIANLQNLKTPYGRTYLQIVQDIGSLSLLSVA
jgi:hypothetical protein